MINFQHCSLKTFLNEYWQKKPLIIRQALPYFDNPLSPDELAGLSLEEEVESRLVFETPDQKPNWHLRRGPFITTDFNNLPPTHWTLLVQGVDRLLPDVAHLLDHFDFIPQWRIDDVMISYAVLHGSVGPHYDNYDVFLYQAQGRREWRLTSKSCTSENCIEDLELRIMNEFDVEETLVLEEGDMLYLPPHVGHYGISLSEECMTYSFGYRSYQGQELLDSFCEYVSEKELFKDLYLDPDWSHLNNTAEISKLAWQNAQKLLHQVINNEKIMKSWFGCFATQMDHQAELQLPLPLEEDEAGDLPDFINEVRSGLNLIRNSCCRFAFSKADHQSEYLFYINGCEWNIEGISHDLLTYVANHRYLSSQSLSPFLHHEHNQEFIYDLWKLQWLQSDSEMN